MRSTTPRRPWETAYFEALGVAYKWAKSWGVKLDSNKSDHARIRETMAENRQTADAALILKELLAARKKAHYPEKGRPLSAKAWVETAKDSCQRRADFVFAVEPVIRTDS